MTSKKVILITGATGKQGGATLKYLVRHGGFSLRAMTRNPDGEGAKKLKELGIEVVKGDLNDSAATQQAVQGAWGVYAVQNTWEAGVAQEEEQGKSLAKVARSSGVEHFVYASVGSANKSTGIPHFDNKFRIEQSIKGLGFPSYVIIRPVFFMENLPTPWFLHGDKLMTAMKPTTKLQMIAADDIGKFGAEAFVNAAKHKNAEVDIAGDSITMVQAAEGVSEILGKKITFESIPIEAIKQNSEDMAIMLEWFDRVGYSANIPALEATWGIRPITFDQWVKSHHTSK